MLLVLGRIIFKNGCMGKITEASRCLRKNATEAESIFWEYVRGRRVDNYKIVRQHPIIFDYEGGKRFFVADFFCKKRKLIIEIDGGVYGVSEQKERDVYRDFLCHRMGYCVFRFSNEQVVRDKEGILDILKKTLKEKEFPSGLTRK